MGDGQEKTKIEPTKIKLTSLVAVLFLNSVGLGQGVRPAVRSVTLITF